MHEKIWYIEIEGAKEGPYSYQDLKRDERIHPDTLIWKQGFPKWVPIRCVWELRDLFTDDESTKPEIDDRPKFKPLKEGEALTLEASWFQPPFIVLIILIILATYFLYQLVT